MYSSFQNNPDLDGIAYYEADIVFSSAHGRPLCLQLLRPAKASSQTRCPLVMYIEGSGWTHPDSRKRLPMLASLAKTGYVVASIVHRSNEEAAFPAFLQDAKTALRFLRAHSQVYGIDPERVGVWGNSSGGNTALLMAVTPGMYTTGEYPQYSDRVSLTVACYAPTDIPALIRDTYPEAYRNSGHALDRLSGRPMADSEEILLAMSPAHLLKAGMDLGPSLLIHGDQDKVVDINQSENCYHKLIALGYEAQLARVEGAPHSGTFWSPAVEACIFDFIRARL